MIAVIPMAGNGQRFKDAGYDVPKPLLPMPDGRILLQHIIASLPQVEQVITISKPTLELKPEYFTPYAWYPVHVKRETRGPLDTLREARALLNTKKEILIHYCDLFLPDSQCEAFVHEMRKRQQHAGVVCFPSHDPRFQREPSNRFAMSGIFYFKQGNEFLRAMNGYHDQADISPGHIAFSMRGFLGLSVTGAYVTDNIVDLGVPQTYALYCAMQKAKMATVETYEEFIASDIDRFGKAKGRMEWLMYKTLRQTVTPEETIELNGMIEAERSNNVSKSQ